MAAKKRTKKSDPPPLDPPEPSPPPRAAGKASKRAASQADAPSDETSEPRFRVVGIGASAGGLEALTQLLHAMSPDSGMAFVIVSHLDPEHKSALDEILSRATAMPVSEATDGMAIEPNHVYVMPPNYDMVVAHEALRLSPRVETHRPHSPVDGFLRSLARDYANCAVGVVLSGTGCDGTFGLKEIREAGGLTFAQDDTAQFNEMPRSAVAAGVVDAVLPPEKIAAELLRIARQPQLQYVPETPSPEGPAEDEVFLQILRLLAESSGVDVVHYKHSTLRRRIERRLLLRRLRTLDEYLQRLRQDVAERKLLLEEVLIPVTSFFRDPETFEALKTNVLPRLMARRPVQAPFRVWVPGCASGEEAYSVAICLLEYLGAAEEALPIKIFATDISQRAIEAARAGIYGEGIASEVSAERLRRYFLKTDRGYEVGKAVRDLCIFARQDLTKDPPFSQLDLVTCRNVLIYLGSVLQDRVIPILHYALVPGGVLVLGGSETVARHTDLFKAIDARHKFYERSATPSRLTFEYAPKMPVPAPTVREVGTQRGGGLPDVYREADRVVLAHYAPNGVLVDENFHVLQYRGDTGPYLKPAPGPPTTDLLLMAREGLLGDLRETLDRARRENTPARKEGVRVKTNDHFTDIDLRVIPIADLVSAVRYFVVLFANRAEAAVPRPPAPPPGDGGVGERPRNHPPEPLPRFDEGLPAIGDRTKRGRQRGIARRQRRSRQRQRRAAKHQRGTDDRQGRAAGHERGAEDRQRRDAKPHPHHQRTGRRPGQPDRDDPHSARGAGPRPVHPPLHARRPGGDEPAARRRGPAVLGAEDEDQRARPGAAGTRGARHAGDQAVRGGRPGRRLAQALRPSLQNPGRERSAAWC